MNNDLFKVGKRFKSYSNTYEIVSINDTFKKFSGGLIMNVRRVLKNGQLSKRLIPFWEIYGDTVFNKLLNGSDKEIYFL